MNTPMMCIQIKLKAIVITIIAIAAYAIPVLFFSAVIDSYFRFGSISFPPKILFLGVAFIIGVTLYVFFFLPNSTILINDMGIAKINSLRLFNFQVVRTEVRCK